MITHAGLQAAANKANSKLTPIQEAVKAVASSAVSELLTLPCAPPLTWNVLKAMLLVMGKAPADMDTWRKCRSACITLIHVSSAMGVVSTGIVLIHVSSAMGVVSTGMEMSHVLQGLAVFSPIASVHVAACDHQTLSWIVTETNALERAANTYSEALDKCTTQDATSCCFCDVRSSWVVCYTSCCLGAVPSCSLLLHNLQIQSKMTTAD